MKIKKLKIISLFLMAFFVFGCVDNQEEKTKPAPAPKPPVVEPTTEPATEPFKISIADIKDYYGFGVIYSKIHLTDKDGNIIKTKVLDNQLKKLDEYISQVEFKDLAVKEYKLCFQKHNSDRLVVVDRGVTKTNDNICDYWLTETNEKSTNTNLTDDKSQAQIINTNLLLNLALPKKETVVLSVFDKNNNLFDLSKINDLSRGVYLVNDKEIPTNFTGIKNNQIFFTNPNAKNYFIFSFLENGNLIKYFLENEKFIKTTDNGNGGLIDFSKKQLFNLSLK